MKLESLYYWCYVFIIIYEEKIIRFPKHRSHYFKKFNNELEIIDSCLQTESQTYEIIIYFVKNFLKIIKNINLIIVYITLLKCLFKYK